MSPGEKRAMTPCLLFDADDTLWENNIYFQRAIEEFLGWIAPFAPDRRHVHHVLSQIERQNIPRRGYGTRNFLDSLHETFRRFYSGGDGEAHGREIERIGERLLNHPLDLLPGVEVTLAILRPHYRLMLFTKGDPEEQRGKLRRSGLERFFDCAEVVEEKNAAAYRELVRRHGLRSESTAMIGNSPRSDVLPALEAGLWAVFVPHPHTWEMEDDRVAPHPRLLVTESFRELPTILSKMQI